ncbi:hypothetical protein [Kitasatospora sp. NPDC089509]|uniref:hypothetical protein n=1 Tax=Kitasatospora sp. NPDC089509 TaxID=3364079 RepID=UPI00380D5BAA
MAHPLTSLRAELGLSQREYARLVARAHDELGLGRMAARREKISRWESGHIVPEHSAQLAIAHIHGVPPREVARLGWPYWTYLATSDDPLDGARTGLRLHADRVSRPSHASASPSGFSLHDDGLALQVRGALARLAEHSPDPAHETQETAAAADERVHWSETRAAALEAHILASHLPSQALYSAAHTEHRQAIHLLTSTAHGGAESRRLLRLSAGTALLCSGFSCALGELGQAERHALTAIRAAAAAGDRATVATAMTQLARHHLIVGNAADALVLLRAARRADPDLPASTLLELHNCEASAFAQLGRATDAARALDRAAEAFTRAGRTAAGSGTDTEAEAYRRFVAMGRAAVWSFLGQPRKARPHLAVLADNLTAPVRTPSPFSALWFFYIVHGHLELGELDVAAHAVHRACALTGGLPPVLAADLRRLLAPHQHEHPLHAALDDLRAASAP